MCNNQARHRRQLDLSRFILNNLFSFEIQINACISFLSQNLNATALNSNELLIDDENYAWYNAIIKAVRLNQPEEVKPFIPDLIQILHNSCISVTKKSSPKLIKIIHSENYKFFS